jgi:hypothetical protein
LAYDLAIVSANANAAFAVSSGEDFMTVPDWLNWLTAAKTTMEIFKGIKSELPQGQKADEAERQIEKAEVSLRSSEIELAKAVGYNLCQCTWPPQVMLWREQDKVFRCPNPQCGRTIHQPPEIHSKA